MIRTITLPPQEAYDLYHRRVQGKLTPDDTLLLLKYSRELEQIRQNVLFSQQINSQYYNDLNTKC